MDLIEKIAQGNRELKEAVRKRVRDSNLEEELRSWALSKKEYEIEYEIGKLNDKIEELTSRRNILKRLLEE